MSILPKTITISLLTLFAIPLMLFFSTSEVDATNCTSAKCQAAAAAEQAANEKAANAAAAADTLAGEVARLNDEIAAYEAHIATNTAIAEDLATSIQQNTEKLAQQQAALAELLVDMHFDEQPEAIMILAGSTSISDYAERQSRADSVKEQVALSTQAVKTLKQELENQKTEVDRVIADQELQRANIASKRAEQQALEDKYRDNADAYTEEAKKARAEKIAAMAEEIASRNNSGSAVYSSDSTGYPYAGSCPPADPWNQLGPVDNLGYYACQCTSYAAYRAYLAWGVGLYAWGHAYQWYGVAKNTPGFHVSDTPAANTVAVEVSYPFGHVMWVESVNPNGTINLSEYNNYGSSASGLPQDYGERVGVDPSAYSYIYKD